MKSISRSGPNGSENAFAQFAATDADHVEGCRRRDRRRAVGVGDAGDHPFGGNARFVFARQHAHRRAPGGFRTAHELRSLTRRARQPSPPLAHRDVQTSASILNRASASSAMAQPSLLQPSGRHHVATDSADRFFVVQVAAARDSAS